MKTLRLIATVLFCAGMAYADHPKLPQPILNTLDAEYPGWALAPISKLLIPVAARGEYSNLISRDFDGDGKTDHAVTINYIDRQDNVRNATIVFMPRGTEFKDYTLAENWLGPEHRLVYAPGNTVLHWVPKGQPGYQVEEDVDANYKQAPPLLYPESGLEIINLGKSASVFKWDGDGFLNMRRGKGHSRLE